MERIGQKIKEIRIKKGLSQKELAERIGCAPNTISGWERDSHRGPNKKLIGKVAQILDVSIDYLLSLEKIEGAKIPCYGEFPTNEFLWPRKVTVKKYIEVMAEEYVPGRFALKIVDDLLEPIVLPGDYAIFEKVSPKDGDIVAVRFPENNDKGMIKRWRQDERTVMLLETNSYKACPPHSFHIYQELSDKLSYIIKLDPREHIIIEGKLVGVKRKMNDITYHNSVN